MSQPSIKQMLARASSVHHRILRALRTGESIVTGATTDTDWRGYRTAMATLKRWGCVRSSVPRCEVTERGIALLNAYDSGKAHGAASDDSGKSTPPNRNPGSRPCANEPTFSLGHSLAGAAAMMLIGPPLVAWRAFVAATDETAHIAAWHAHRDSEFQRDFARRHRPVQRPFNRT